MVPQRKKTLFRLSLAAAGGCIGSVVIAILSLLILLILILSPIVNLANKFASISASTNNSSSPLLVNAPLMSNDRSLLLVNASHNWIGLRNQAVVDAALYVASGLYNVPPETNDTWYHADLIPDAVHYWSVVCTDSCAANWAEGNLQCVMLVTASYALTGQPLPFIGNAIDFWASGAYLHQPDWQEVPASAVPLPGDIIVMANGGFGHVAIVTDVKLPDPAGQGGYVQFAQSNGPGALNQEPFSQDANGDWHMSIWPHYTVETYIRHVSALSTPQP